MKRKTRNEIPVATIRQLPEIQSSMLAFALKSVSESVCITDLDDIIMFVNDSFVRTYGYSEKELIGQPISFVRSPGNSPEVLHSILPATKVGGWRGELMNRRKNGEIFPVSIATSVIYDDNGNAVAIMGIASDITERKKVENALRESERYARALMDAIPDMMFRMNRESVYLDCKAGVEDLYFQVDTIIGKQNRDITPGYFAELIDNKIKSALETGTMEVFEYELPIPNRGMRVFEARMVCSGQDEVTTIARDITERKQAEEAIRKKVKELEYFNNLMVNRELKMIDLKKEVNSLLNRLGDKDKYIIHEGSEI